MHSAKRENENKNVKWKSRGVDDWRDWATTTTPIGKAARISRAFIAKKRTVALLSSAVQLIFVHFEPGSDIGHWRTVVVDLSTREIHTFDSLGGTCDDLMSQIEKEITMTFRIAGLSEIEGVFSKRSHTVSSLSSLSTLSPLVNF